MKINLNIFSREKIEFIVIYWYGKISLVFKTNNNIPVNINVFKACKGVL